MARKKPRGWVGEPVRHGQAARGIKSAKQKVKQAQVTVDPVLQAVTRLKLGWNDELPGTAEYKASWGGVVKQRRSLHFTTKGLTQRQAGGALALASQEGATNKVFQYNDFKPDVVADVLLKMRLDLGKVYIGREGSPVIYFEGASPEAVNAFLKNLAKRDKWGLPDEFGGPKDVPMMKRNTMVAGFSPPAAPIKSVAGLKKSWRLWWD